MVKRRRLEGYRWVHKIAKTAYVLIIATFRLSLTLLVWLNFEKNVSTPGF